MTAIMLRAIFWRNCRVRPFFKALFHFLKFVVFPVGIMQVNGGPIYNLVRMY